MTPPAAGAPVNPIEPPVWSEEELEADRRVAIARFRDDRIAEPLRRYLEAFDARRPLVAGLIDRLLGGPLPADDDATVAAALSTEAKIEALRYLAAPPISADDLKILADTESLAPRALLAEPARARMVYATVLMALDRRRFPWVGARAPTEAEREAAIVASVALLATRRTETDRRSEGKTTQEGAVYAALEEAGLRREPARVIATLDEAPAPGGFCGESMLGGRKADIVVRLWDRRVLAVECKVSNSATNSIKRLNNDAAVKAGQWLRELGTRQLIPSALLAGVFKLRNLLDAQAARLTLWWSHDLGRLQRFVDSTRAFRTLAL